MSGFETLLGVAGLVGAGLSAGGRIVGGIAESRMQRDQAAVAATQAERERQAAAAEEEDYRVAASAAAARDRARRAASGVDVQSGTSLLLQEDVAGEAELGALRIRDLGNVRALRLEQEANLRRRAADNALFGGFANAGTTLLTAAGTRWPRSANALDGTTSAAIPSGRALLRGARIPGLGL